MTHLTHENVVLRSDFSGPCAPRARTRLVDMMLHVVRHFSTSSSSYPPLFAKSGRQPLGKGQLRLAQTVLESLHKTFASRIIKDRGFDDGAAVHVIDVQVPARGTVARVLWEPMHEGYDHMKIKKALERKKGILRKHVNSWVNQRYAVQLEFISATDIEGNPSEAIAAAAAKDALFAAVRADLQERRHLRRSERADEGGDGDQIDLDHEQEQEEHHREQEPGTRNDG